MPEEPTQAEKLRVLKETLLSRAGHAEPGLVQANVVGSRAVPEYPRLPPNSPWAADPGPPEPPLGEDVNALEPVGTAAEIEASRKGKG